MSSKVQKCFLPHTNFEAGEALAALLGSKELAIQDREATVDELKQKLRDLQAQLNQKKGQENLSGEPLQTLDWNNKYLQQQVQQLSEQLDKQQRRADEAASKLHSVEASKEGKTGQLQTELVKLTYREKELDKEVAWLKSELEKAWDQRSKQSAKITDLTLQLAGLQEELAARKAQTTKVENEAKRFADAHNKMAERKGDKDKEVAGFRQRLADLEEKLEDAKRKYHQLQVTAGQQEQKLHNALEERKKLEEKYHVVDMEKAQAAARITELESDVRKYNNDARRFKRELEGAHKDVDEWRKRATIAGEEVLGSVSNQLEAIREENRILERDRDEWKRKGEQIPHLTKQLETFREQLRLLEREKSDGKQKSAAEIQKLNVQIEGLHDDKRRIERERDDWKRRAEHNATDTQYSVALLEEENSRLKQELQQCQVQIAERLDLLKDENRKMEKDKEEYKRKAESGAQFYHQLDNLKAQIKELEHERNEWARKADDAAGQNQFELAHTKREKDAIHSKLVQLQEEFQQTSNKVQQLNEDRKRLERERDAFREKADEFLIMEKKYYELEQRNKELYEIEASLRNQLALAKAFTQKEKLSAGEVNAVLEADVCNMKSQLLNSKQAEQRKIAAMQNECDLFRAEADRAKQMLATLQQDREHIARNENETQQELFRVKLENDSIKSQLDNVRRQLERDVTENKQLQRKVLDAEAFQAQLSTERDRLAAQLRAQKMMDPMRVEAPETGPVHVRRTSDEQVHIIQQQPAQGTNPIHVIHPQATQPITTVVEHVAQGTITHSPIRHVTTTPTRGGYMERGQLEKMKVQIKMFDDRAKRADTDRKTLQSVITSLEHQVSAERAGRLQMESELRRVRMTLPAEGSSPRANIFIPDHYGESVADLTKKIEQLSEKLAHFDGVAYQKEQEAERLRGILLDRDAEIARLRAEKNPNLSAIDALTAARLEMDDKVSKMREENDDLRAKAVDLKLEIQSLNDKAEKRKAKEERREHEKKRWSEMLDQQARDAQEKIDELADSLKDKMKELSRADELRRELEMKGAAQERTILNLKAEIEREQDMVKRLQRDLMDTSHERSSYTPRTADITAELRKLQMQVDAKDFELERKGRQLNQYETLIKDGDDTISKLRNEIKGLKDKLIQLEEDTNDLHRLKDRHDKLKGDVAELDHIKAHLTETTAKLRDVTARLQSEEHRNLEMTRELERLKLQMVQAELKDNQLNDLKQQLEQAQRRIADLVREEKDNKLRAAEQLAELARLRTVDDKYRSIEDSFNKSSAQLTAIEAELFDSRQREQDASKYEHECSALQRLMELKESQLTELQNHCTQLVQSLAYEEAAHRECDEKNETQNTELLLLKQELEDKTAEADALQKRLWQAAAEEEAMKAQFSLEEAAKNKALDDLQEVTNELSLITHDRDAIQRELSVLSTEHDHLKKTHAMMIANMQTLQLQAMDELNQHQRETELNRVKSQVEVNDICRQLEQAHLGRLEEGKRAAELAEALSKAADDKQTISLLNQKIEYFTHMYDMQATDLDKLQKEANNTKKDNINKDKRLEAQNVKLVQLEQKIANMGGEDPKIVALISQVAQFRENEAALKQRAALSQLEQDKLQNKLERMEEEQRRLQKQLATAESGIQSGSTKSDYLQNRLNDVALELEKVRATEKRHVAEIQDLMYQNRDLENQNAAKDQVLNGVKDSEKELREERSKLRTTIQVTENQLNDKQQQIKDMLNSINRLEREADSNSDALAELQQEGRKKDAENRALSDKLQEMKKTDFTNEKLKLKNDALMDKNSKLQQQVASLECQLGCATQNCQQFEAGMREAKAHVASLSQSLSYWQTLASSHQSDGGSRISLLLSEIGGLNSQNISLQKSLESVMDQTASLEASTQRRTIEIEQKPPPTTPLSPLPDKYTKELERKLNKAEDDLYNEQLKVSELSRSNETCRKSLGTQLESEKLHNAALKSANDKVETTKKELLRELEQLTQCVADRDRQLRESDKVKVQLEYLKSQLSACEAKAEGIRQSVERERTSHERTKRCIKELETTLEDRECKLQQAERSLGLTQQEAANDKTNFQSELNQLNLLLDRSKSKTDQQAEEVRRLEKALRIAEGGILSGSTQVEQLETRLREKCMDLEKLRVAEEKLVGDLHEVKQKLTEAESKWSIKDIQLKDLDNTIAELREERAKLKTNLEVNEVILNDKTKQLHECSLRESESQNEVQSLRRSLGTSEKSLLEHKNTIQNMREQLRKESDATAKWELKASELQFKLDDMLHLSKKVEDLQRRLQDQQSSNSRCEQLLHESQLRVQEQENELSSLRDQNSKLDTSVRNLTADTDRTSLQYQRTINQLDVLQGDKRRLEGKVRELESRLATCDAKTESLAQRLIDSQNDYRTQEVELVKTKEQVADLQTASAELQKSKLELVTTNQHLRECTKQLDTTQDELQREKAINQSLQFDVKGLQGELVLAEEASNRLKVLLKELQQSVPDAQEAEKNAIALVTLRTETAHLTAQVQELQSNKELLTETNADLEQQTTKLKGEVTQLKREGEALQQQLQVSESKESSCKREMETQSVSHQRELEKAQEHMKKLRVQLRDAEEESQAHENEKIQLKTKLDLLQGAIEDKVLEIDQITERAEHKEALMNDLQRQLNDITEKATRLEMELETQRGRTREAKRAEHENGTEVAKLKEQLQQEIADKNGLQEKLSTARQEAVRAAEGCKTASTAAQQMRDRNEGLCKELDELSQKLLVMEHSTQEKTQLADSLHTSELALEEANARIGQLEGAKKSQEEALTLLQRELAEVSSRNQSREQQHLEELREKDSIIKTFKDDCSRLQSDVLELQQSQTDADELTRDLKGAQHQLQNAERNNTELHSNVSRLTSELEHAQQDHERVLTQKNNEISLLNERVELLTTKAANLEVEVEAKARHAEDQKERALEALEEKHADEIHKLTDTWKKELENAQGDFTKLKADADKAKRQYEHQLNEIKESFQKTEKEHEVTQEKLDQAINQKNSKLRELEEAHSQIDLLKIDIANSNELRDTMTTEQAQLRSELAKYQKKLDEANTELQHTKDKLQDASHSNNSLQSQITRLTTKEEETVKIRQTLESKLEKAKSQMQDLSSQLSDQESKTLKLEGIIRDLTSQVARMDQKDKQLEGIQSQLEAKLDEATVETHELTAQLKNSQQTITELKRTIRELTEQINGLGDELAEEQQHTAKLTEKKTKWKSRFRASEKKAGVLEKQIQDMLVKTQTESETLTTELTRQNKQLRLQLVSLEQKSEELQEQLKEQEAMEKELKVAEMQRKSLQGNLDEYKAQTEALQDELKDHEKVERELREAEMLIKSLRGQLEEHQSQFEQQQDRTKWLEEVKDRLEKDIQEFDAKCKTKEAELEKLEAECEEMKAENQGLVSEVTNKQSMIEELLEKIDHMDAQIRDLSADLEATLTKNADDQGSTHARIHELLSQVTSYRQQLADKEAANQRNQKQFEEVNSQFSSMGDKKAKWKQRYRALDTEVSHVRTQNGSLETGMTRQAGELSSLTERYAIAQNEIGVLRRELEAALKNMPKEFEVRWINQKRREKNRKLLIRCVAKIVVDKKSSKDVFISIGRDKKMADSSERVKHVHASIKTATAREAAFDIESIKQKHEIEARVALKKYQRKLKQMAVPSQKYPKCTKWRKVVAKMLEDRVRNRKQWALLAKLTVGQGKAVQKQLYVEAEEAAEQQKTTLRREATFQLNVSHKRLAYKRKQMEVEEWLEAQKSKSKVRKQLMQDISLLTEKNQQANELIEQLQSEISRLTADLLIHKAEWEAKQKELRRQKYRAVLRRCVAKIVLEKHKMSNMWEDMKRHVVTRKVAKHSAAVEQSVQDLLEVEKNTNTERERQRLQIKRRKNMKVMARQLQQDIKQQKEKGIYIKCIKWKQAAWKIIFNKRVSRVAWLDSNQFLASRKKGETKVDIITSGLSDILTGSEQMEKDRHSQQAAIAKRLDHKRKVMKIQTHLDPMLAQKRERRKTLAKLAHHVAFLEGELQRKDTMLVDMQVGRRASVASGTSHRSSSPPTAPGAFSSFSAGSSFNSSPGSPSGSFSNPYPYATVSRSFISSQKTTFSPTSFLPVTSVILSDSHSSRSSTSSTTSRSTEHLQVPGAPSPPTSAEIQASPPLPPDDEFTI